MRRPNVELVLIFVPVLVEFIVVVFTISVAVMWVGILAGRI